MNLEHRLSGYDIQKPITTCLVDATGNMVDRAEAVLFLIQNEFIGDSRTLEDSVIFQSLESVRMELQDIKAVTEHYHEAKR